MLKQRYKIGVSLSAIAFAMTLQPAMAAGEEWTSWMSRDTPGSNGDYDLLEGFLTDGKACEAPVAVECRVIATQADWSTTGQVYTCEPAIGGRCINADQAGPMCLDYEVRFDCQIQKLTPQPFWMEPKVQILGAGGALALLGLGWLALRPRKVPTPPSPPTGGKMLATNTAPQTPTPKKKPKAPEKAGLVFAASPMVAASGAAQGTAAQAASLTGPYAILAPAFQATGRIGFAQDGIPKGDDIAFGTGFLITPQHVLTNRHVYEMYREHLLADGGGGIEFFAERGSDETAFAIFDGAEPLVVDDLDIAVFKLATPVTDRKPIAPAPIANAALDQRDIVVIGYPCPQEVTDEIKALVEDDPVFAVKRISEGKVFKHSTDTDTEYGVEAAVSQVISPKGTLNAICHNASTMGGSSGSPILDKVTGELLGIHFGYDVAHNWGEPANFAIPVADLVTALKDLGLT